MSPGIMWLLWMLAYRIRFYQIINKISDADIVDGARDFSPDEKEYGRCDYFRDAVIKIK